MNLTALVPLPYRILAIVLLIGACIGFGYVKGVSREADRRDALDARAQQAAQLAANNESARRAEIGAQREVTREKIRVVYRTIKEKADETVKNNSGAYACSLDADGLREWNAANAGASVALSGKPDYRLSGAAAGDVGKVGRLVAKPYRSDGVIRPVPGPAPQAGGLRVNPLSLVDFD